MAFWRCAIDQFCRGSGAADSISVGTEATCGASTGDAGTGFFAGFLRSFAVYVCRADPAWERGYAERVEAVSAAGSNLGRDAADGENVLEVGNQDRAKGRSRVRRTACSERAGTVRPTESRIQRRDNLRQISRAMEFPRI